MSYKFQRFPWLLIVLLLLTTGSLFALLPDVTIVRGAHFDLLVGWLICLVLYTLFDFIAGSVAKGLWAGYLYFMVLVTWLAAGVGATLLLIYTGSTIAWCIRLFYNRQRSEPVDLPGIRIVIQAAGLLVAAGVFSLVGCVVPGEGRLTVGQFLCLLPPLAAGLITTQIVGLLLIEPPLRIEVMPRLFWAKGQRQRIWQEIVMMIAAPVVALLLMQAGVIAFGVVIGIVGLQAFRYHEIQTTQQSLERRVEQLSTLDSMSRDLAANLNFEEVLFSIYRRVNQFLGVSTFYIVLYNSELDTQQFPLVIIDGQRVSHDPIEQSPSAADTKNRRPSERFEPVIAKENYAAFAGLPLVSGEEVLGSMCFARKSGGAFTEDDLNIARMIAHQAGLAIRNASLYNRSEEIRHNLARINKFMQEIVFSTDINTAVRTACAVAMDISHADRIGVFLVQEDDRRHLALMHQINFTPAYEAWLANQVMDSYHPMQQTITYNDIHAVSFPELMAEAEIGGFKSKAEIPMRSGSTPMGIMTIYYNKPHHYDPAEIELLETLASQIAAALDNAELLKVLEVYASEQAQLVHLSRTSTATLELEQVINTVLTLLRHMLNAERVYLGLVDAPHHSSMDFYGIEGEALYQLKLSDVAQIHTLDTIPQFYGLEDASEGVRDLMTHCGDETIVAASLVVNNEFIGSVILGTPYHFGDAETRLLELATNQIAVQIHNARQYRLIEDALERRLRQLSVLENIARQISSALNVEQLISNVLEAAIQATQGDMAALALITESGDFQIIGREFVEGRWRVRNITRSPGAGIMGRVARNRERAIVNDNNEDPDYLSTLTQKYYQSSLVVPLLKDQEVIGVLDIESVHPDFFRDEHAEFVESLAGHAVISIQNAHLLQERQRQIDVLTSLRRLSLKLSSDTDRHSVINEILQTALTIIQGVSAGIYHYVEETREFTYMGGLTRTDEGDFTEFFVKVPQTLLQVPLDTGEAQIIQNIHHIPDFNMAVDYTSVILAPLKRGNRVQEIAAVTFSRERINLQDALNTLELLLIQAAGHLENTVLYERVLAGNNRLRVFLDSSSDGIILLDAQNNLVQANVSAERMLGISLYDHTGENFTTRLLDGLDSSDISHDAREALRNMARILRLEPEKITRRQFELRRRGQPLYIEEVTSPVFDAQNKNIGRLLVLRDVTEEKMLLDYREEITNMIVHDLRGPLSAIYSGLSYSRLLLDDEAETAPTDALVPVLEVAVNSTDKLLGLVDSLLDIAKLESRSMPLSQTPVALPALIDEVTATMTSLFKDAEIELMIQLPEALPLLYVDESKIRRVLINLLDNAQRFSPQGGTILIQAVVIENSSKVLVRVVDSGRGIPVEEHERIFDKFRQVSSNTPARGKRGTGLGLTFCKLVLEAHGERLWVEATSPLSGASFAFTLPVYTEPTP